MYAALIVALILALGLLGLHVYAVIRIANSLPPLPSCSGCREPLLHFTAVHEGKALCRACCRARGIPPWYWLPELGDPWK